MTKEEPGKPDRLLVKRTITLEYNTPLTAYPDMTPEEARQHEEGLDEIAIIEVLETILEASGESEHGPQATYSVKAILI